MIEFKCPSCDVLLRIPDEKGGKSARCPKCREPIRAPMAPSGVQPKPAPKSAPRPAPAGVPSASPGFEFVDDDEPAAPVKQQVTTQKPAPRPQPAPKPAPPPVVEDAEIDDSSPIEGGDSQSRRRRKRRKRRRRSSGTTAAPMQLSAGLMSVLVMLTVFSVWGMAMALKWLGGVFFAGLFALGLAAILGLVGRCWFLMIAYSDDSTTGTLCLICWPYTIYYLITNIEETWKAFVLECVGGVLVTISLCGGALWDKDDFGHDLPDLPDAPNVVDPGVNDNDPDDGPAPPMPPPVNMPGRPPRRNRRAGRRGRYAPTVASASLRNDSASRAAVSSTAWHWPTHL